MPSEEVIDSYLSHDRQTTVRKDSMITFNKCKYSVPPAYIGKSVRLQVKYDKLDIYYGTDLISTHLLTDKRLNYHSDDYKELLSERIKDADAIEEFAEKNLKQMDLLL